MITRDKEKFHLMTHHQKLAEKSKDEQIAILIPKDNLNRNDLFEKYNDICQRMGKVRKTEEWGRLFKV